MNVPGFPVGVRGRVGWAETEEADIGAERGRACAVHDTLFPLAKAGRWEPGERECLGVSEGMVTCGYNRSIQIDPLG